MAFLGGRPWPYYCNGFETRGRKPPLIVTGYMGKPASNGGLFPLGCMTHLLCARLRPPLTRAPVRVILASRQGQEN